MLLQQKSAQMGNNLAVRATGEQQQQQKTQEQLSSPISQALKTYDFGNFENSQLNSENILIYHQLHSHLYHMHSNLHKGAL